MVERKSQKTSWAGNVCLVERLQACAESFPVLDLALFERTDEPDQMGWIYNSAVWSPSFHTLLLIARVYFQTDHGSMTKMKTC